MSALKRQTPGKLARHKVPGASAFPATMQMRILLLAPVALMAGAIPALASDPATGTVSNASPTVAWTGSSNAYGVYPIHSVAQAG